MTALRQHHPATASSSAGPLHPASWTTVRLARHGQSGAPGEWRGLRGGARVFVQDGIVTKGPPNLLGRDLGRG